MIIDALLQFSGTIVGNTVTAQSLVGAAQTFTSTNVVDLAGVGTGNIARDLGQGKDLTIMVEVVQAFAGGASVQVVLVLADDAAISVNVEQVLLETPLTIAQLPAGTLIPVHVDRVAPLPAKRYMALQYITVGTMTGGSVVAAMVHDVQDKGNNTLFNSGFVVQ
jgi:hypothetical protein